MGSERRQRTEFVAVRLDTVEMAWLVEQAAAAQTSKSELARALIFGREPLRKPVACSSRHADCTRHHRDLVDGYSEQRAREQEQQEDDTGMWRGDLDMWRENGGHLTTFKDWLQANTKGDEQ